MRIENKIRQNIAGQFNWAVMPSLARENDVIKDSYEDTPGGHWLYLGTVFSLYPSGKYYAPFACGNLDNCKSCNGKGTVSVKGSNKNRRSLYRRCNRELNGLVASCLKEYGSHNNWPEEFQITVNLLRLAVEEFSPSKKCPACNGLGSREALLDEIYSEVLEDFARQAGGYITTGDSDPCDIFFVIPAEEVESEDTMTAG
jgi:hypothetical protein